MGLMVVGMHRSGTSAVAEVLARLGLDPGPGTPFEVESGNARGLYEWRETVKYNDEWLRVFGAAWDAPPRITESRWREIDLRELAAGRRRLPYFSGELRNWFVKDPRISLLLPLWDRLLLQHSPAVIVVREPAATAASVRIRSGLLTARSLAVWAEHYRAIMTHLGDRPAIVVNYEDMLAEPVQTITALADFARENGFRVTGHLEAVTESVDPRLRRNRAEPGSAYEVRLVADLEGLYAPLAAAHLSRPPAHLAEWIAPVWVEESLDEASELSRMRFFAEEFREAAEVCEAQLTEATTGGSYRLAQNMRTAVHAVRTRIRR
jgi:hypothetical protein